MTMELPKNTNPPRAFDTDNPAEITRLYKETVGYLRTCKANHHGTDLEGRNFAIAGFKDLLAQPVKADMAQSLADALEECTNMLELFLSTFGDMGDEFATKADLDDWQAALANYRKGE